MAKEIERKFTIRNDNWRSQATRSSYYRQGYMNSNGLASIRVRVSDDKAYLNIKSATLGIFRYEYEYAIPTSDAHEMLEMLCEKPLIEKRRYFVEYEGKTWEIDVFEGDNAGLVVAEIELNFENETFAIPEWAGDDVSHDHRYYNVSLVRHPYKDW